MAAKDPIQPHAMIDADDFPKSSGGKDSEARVTEKEVLEKEIILQNEEGCSAPDRDLKAAVWTIVTGVALPCIPILVISAVLLWYIFAHRIKQDKGWPDLQLPETHDKHEHGFIGLLGWIRKSGGPGYLVWAQSSTITTISSWTSRVIPYLTSSIMALVAFFAARKMVVKSKRGHDHDLPDPEQLTLLITLLSGHGFEPLKDTIMHRYAYGRKLVDPIPLAFTALSLITFVAILIPFFDTWFGIATSAVNIVQLNRTRYNLQSYGRSLSTTRCPNGPGGFTAMQGLEWVSCNLDVVDHGEAVGVMDTYVHDASEAMQVLEGTSTHNVVFNYSETNTSGHQRYYYLADPRMDSKIDFKAETQAVSTQCKLITSQCLPGEAWSVQRADRNFSCTPAFTMNFTFTGQAQAVDGDSLDTSGDNVDWRQPATGLAFSWDADFTARVGAPVEFNAPMYDPNGTWIEANRGTNLSYAFMLPRNPLHFLAWANGYPSLNELETTTYNGTSSNPLSYDPEVYSTDYDTTQWILNCSAVVYDVTYTWVNGSVHSYNATPSTADMGGLMSAPFSTRPNQAAIALNEIAARAGSTNTSEELARTYEAEWSKAALALSIGAFGADENVLEQGRSLVGPVARVPIYPLYLLLGLKGLYVIAVILLAIGAYAFTHPAETEIVKMQLSTKGLAAAHFDDPKLLQNNIVKELEQRLQPQGPTRSATEPINADDAEGPPQPGLKRAATLVGDIPDKRIGIVNGINGVWKYAIIADGVWNSIKPVAVNMVGAEAQKGKLGVAGELFEAWNK